MKYWVPDGRGPVAVPAVSRDPRTHSTDLSTALASQRTRVTTRTPSVGGRRGRTRLAIDSDRRGRSDRDLNALLPTGHVSLVVQIIDCIDVYLPDGASSMLQHVIILVYTDAGVRTARDGGRAELQINACCMVEEGARWGGECCEERAGCAGLPHKEGWWLCATHEGGCDGPGASAQQGKEDG